MKNTVVVSVRMPEDVRDEIVELASVDDRPLSRQIVHLLREALAARKQRKGEPNRE